MRKRIFACMMFLLYMVSLLCISVSAVGINAETEQIDASNLNELSVRLVVNAYFEQRLAYLRGEGDAITAANVPMGNDEAEHKACLETNNITVVDSAVTLDTIECWGNRAFVIAAETAVFLVDGEAIYETILHTITIYNDAENTLLLQSDAYIENVSAFASCSYIPPDREPPVEQQALAGGRNCLVDMAATQIGYTACSDGYTKYGAWYGQLTNQNASKIGVVCDVCFLVRKSSEHSNQHTSMQLGCLEISV